MIDIMNWNECQNNFIREIERDPAKIKSIIETAIQRHEFISKIEVTKENVSFIIEGYYEIIKELMIALLLNNGFRSKNHQCLISYFYKHFKQYEAEAHLISQMSYLRNRLDYYGEQIDFAFYEKNKLKIEQIITILKSLVSKS